MSYAVVLLLVVIISWLLPAMALASERDELFTLSRDMQQKEQTNLAVRSIGVFVTSLGAEGAFNIGGKGEMFLDSRQLVRLRVEGMYLETAKEMAGFLSLSLMPAQKSDAQLYVGVGLGSVEGFAYQLFTGIEVWENLFAEVKYINGPEDLENNVAITIGYQLRF